MNFSLWAAQMSLPDNLISRKLPLAESCNKLRLKAKCVSRSGIAKYKHVHKIYNFSFRSHHCRGVHQPNNQVGIVLLLLLLVAVLWKTFSLSWMFNGFLSRLRVWRRFSLKLSSEKISSIIQTKVAKSERKTLLGSESQLMHLLSWTREPESNKLSKDFSSRTATKFCFSWREIQVMASGARFQT